MYSVHYIVVLLYYRYFISTRRMKLYQCQCSPSKKGKPLYAWQLFLHSLLLISNISLCNCYCNTSPVINIFVLIHFLQYMCYLGKSISCTEREGGERERGGERDREREPERETEREIERQRERGRESTLWSGRILLAHWLFGGYIPAVASWMGKMNRKTLAFQFFLIS